jgi:hypothetical protein
MILGDLIRIEIETDNTSNSLDNKTKIYRENILFHFDSLYLS